MARLPAGIIAFLILAALAASCDSGSESVAVAPAPRLTPTLPPRPTPTPEFAAKILEIAVLPGAHPGQVQVIGLLQGESPVSVEKVRIRVKLISQDGEQLDQAIVPILLNHLAPGEASPFTLNLSASFQGAIARAEVASFQKTTFTRADLEVSPPATMLLEDGGLALTGMVTNRGSSPVALHGLVFAGVDAEAHLQALAIQTAGLSYLEASQSAPYLARTAQAPLIFRWITFQDAVVVPPADPHGLSFAQGPSLRATAQGRPFVVGSLRNQGQQSRLASVLLMLRFEEQILAISQISTSLPLGAGETLPFGQDAFPGLDLRMSELGVGPGDIEVEALIDAGASIPIPEHRVRLELQIDSFDFTGSSLFLRGSVTNPEAITLTRPSLYASARELSGELVTAGWTVLASRLPPAGSIDFVFDMPLPAGAEPAGLEFDLRALALGP